MENDDHAELQGLKILELVADWKVMALIFCENNHPENAVMRFMHFKCCLLEMDIKGKGEKG